MAQLVYIEFKEFKKLMFEILRELDYRIYISEGEYEAYMKYVKQFTIKLR